MLIEAGILLVTYGSLKWFGKQPNKPKLKPKKNLETIDVKKSKESVKQPLQLTDKYEHSRLNSSYLSMGVSITRQFIYSSPLVVTLNLALYTYNAVPYMKETEKSLFKERKLSGHAIDTLLILASIATNQYFAASIIEVIYYLSDSIKAKTQGKSKQMLVNVFDQQPRTVWILRDNIEIEIPLESVKINETVVVTTGDVIPVDGIIIEGMATIDQHALTGESQPTEKAIGDAVFAATTLITGRIYIQIKKAGIDTTIAQIGQILNHTTNFKNSTQLKAEQWSDKAAWPMLGITGLTFLTVGSMGATAALNSNFGYRIKLSGPLGTLNHLDFATQHKILIKDGQSLELLTKIDTILFDKTGTLTQEQPEVGKIFSCDTYKPIDVLRYAAAAEYKLAHPIAKAIIDKAQSENLILPDITDANYQMGYGITVNIQNQCVKVGSLRFMEVEGIPIPNKIEKAMIDCHSQGHSLVFIAINDNVSGAIELKTILRPEIKNMIHDLRKRGIKYLAIISGDHKKPTQRLAQTLAMDDYFYDVLPEEKANIVEKLQSEGRSVCFIGDGINDVIAMKKADVSISLSGATSIATDLAQIVFMDGSLSHLCTLFDISNNLDKQLRKSLMISLIPLPINLMGIFFLHFGLLTTIAINQTSFWIGTGDAIRSLKKEKINHYGL